MYANKNIGILPTPYISKCDKLGNYFNQLVVKYKYFTYEDKLKYFKEYFNTNSIHKIKQRIIFLSLHKQLFSNLNTIMKYCNDNCNMFSLFTGSYPLQFIINKHIMTNDIDISMFPNNTNNTIDVHELFNYINYISIDFVESINNLIKILIKSFYDFELYPLIQKSNSKHFDKVVRALNELIHNDLKFQFSIKPDNTNIIKLVVYETDKYYNSYIYALSDIFININVKNDLNTNIINHIKNKVGVDNLLTKYIQPSYKYNVWDFKNIIPQFIKCSLNKKTFFMPSLNYYYFEKLILYSDITSNCVYNQYDDYLKKKFKKHLEIITT